MVNTFEEDDVVRVKMKYSTYKELKELLTHKRDKNLRKAEDEDIFNMDKFESKEVFYYKNRYKFKYYNANELYAILENEFYQDTKIDTENVINSIFTFRSYLKYLEYNSHKDENNIDTYKFNSKILKYNFYDIIYLFEFHLSNARIEEHLLLDFDITKLTKMQLGEILHLQDRSLNKIIDIINDKTNHKNDTNEYNLLNILEMFKTTKKSKGIN